MKTIRSLLLILATACTAAAQESAPILPPTGDSTPMPEPARASGAGSSYSEVSVDGPYIAITFDDGPVPKSTPRLLDMLKARGIKATFFVIGQNAREFPAILKRTHDEGHELANHSWSHPSLAKLSNDGVRSQLVRTQDAIKAATGFTPTLMRPPYGAITKTQKKWIPEELGLKVILWSVDPLDWKYRSASRVESAILKETRNGAIILAHDIHATTVDAMPATLDALLAKGFKFVTVSELLVMERPPAPKATPAPAPSPALEEAPVPVATPIPTARAIPVEPQQ